MKKPSQLLRRSRLNGVLGVFAAGAICIATIAVFHIQTLSVRVQTLEAQIAQMTIQAEAFDRSFCTNISTNNAGGKTARYSLVSSGIERTYQVHTPRNYDPSKRYPVIVNFDGIEGSGARMESYSGMNELPALAVYPDSVPGKTGFTAWQGAPYSQDGDYDVQFIREMMDQLPSQYCVDSARVFAVGMSNGGGFAVIAGCRLSEVFTAVASVAGAYYTPCHDTKRQPSILAIHGIADKQVPYLGSRSRGLPQVIRWAESQANERECNDFSRTAEGDTATQYSWVGCEDQSIVRLVVLENRGHGWLLLPPGLRGDAPTTAGYIWDFFEEAVYSHS